MSVSMIHAGKSGVSGGGGAPWKIRRTRHLVQVVDRAGELVCTIDPSRPLDEQLALAGGIAASSGHLVRREEPGVRRVVSISRIGPVFGATGGTR